MDRDDERALLIKLRRRDEAAFNGFVRLYEGRVFSLALRLLGDRAEAEDVTQEVFVAVFRAIDGFRGDAQLSTWLFRVTTNHCRNRIKFLARRARPGAIEAEEILDRGSVPAAADAPTSTLARPDQQAEANQTEAAIQRALAALDDEQREMIVLRDLEGFAYEEIAEMTGLAVGTVKSRIHRARQALEDALERALGRKGGTRT